MAESAGGTGCTACDAARVDHTSWLVVVLHAILGVGSCVASAGWWWEAAAYSDASCGDAEAEGMTDDTVGD